MVLKGDVLDFLSRTRPHTQALPPPASSAGPAPTASSGPAAAAGAAAAAAAAASRPAVGGALRFEDVPLGSERRAAGEALRWAKQQVPHAYLAIDVTVDHTLQLLQQAAAAQQQQQQQGGQAGEPTATVTLREMVVRSAASALRANPAMQVGWNAAQGQPTPLAASAPQRHPQQPAQQRLLQEPPLLLAVDLAASSPSSVSAATASAASAATAPPSAASASSVVVVVPDADRIGLLAVAAALRSSNSSASQAASAASAASASLGVVFESQLDASTPIVVPPLVAKLSVGRPRRLLVLDATRPRVTSVVTATLSIDTRCIDEQTAASFLSSFSRALTDPTSA